jgi:hypothetical protein
MYTRPQNKAPGHLESRRWEYQVVSHGWHHLLGFTNDLTSITPADLDPDKNLRANSMYRNWQKHVQLDNITGKSLWRLKAS